MRKKVTFFFKKYFYENSENHLISTCAGVAISFCALAGRPGINVWWESGSANNISPLAIIYSSPSSIKNNNLFFSWELYLFIVREVIKLHTDTVILLILPSIPYEFQNKSNRSHPVSYMIWWSSHDVYIWLHEMIVS